jgi:hypothetical protein
MYKIINNFLHINRNANDLIMKILNYEKKLRNKMNYLKWNNKNMMVYYNNSKNLFHEKKEEFFVFCNRLQFAESCGIALLDYQTKKSLLEQRSTAVCSYHSFCFSFI